MWWGEMNSPLRRCRGEEDRLITGLPQQCREDCAQLHKHQNLPLELCRGRPPSWIARLFLRDPGGNDQLGRLVHSPVSPYEAQRPRHMASGCTTLMPCSARSSMSGRSKNAGGTIHRHRGWTERLKRQSAGISRSERQIVHRVGHLKK